MDGVAVEGGGDLDVAVGGVFGAPGAEGRLGQGVRPGQRLGGGGEGVTSPMMSSSLLMRSSVVICWASVDVDMVGVPCQEAAVWGSAVGCGGQLAIRRRGTTRRCGPPTRPGGFSAAWGDRGGVPGQALITLGPLPPVIWILRGLAFSAMGRRRVSTPAS